MELSTIKAPGADALRLLEEHRSQYPTTGRYPFLIGDAEEMERMMETAGFHAKDASAIIRDSFDITVADWIKGRRGEAEEYEFSAEETLGEWPDETAEKGSISLHKDTLTDKIKPEVFIGLATIEMPWQLPAIVKYGSWNDCPEPEVHCAFHHHWQGKYGAEITGMSGDVVECKVARPPRDRKAALELAWEQYWYCGDIVDQGCGSVANLAAALMDSPYWFFWWD